MKSQLKQWKPAGVLVIIGIVLLLGRNFPLKDTIGYIAGPLRELGWLGILLYSLLYIAAGMLCLPCLPLTLMGGYIFGTFGGVIAVHAGATVGAAFGFLTGRHWGHAHVTEFLRKCRRFHFLEHAVAQEGWKIVALLRLHPIPFGLSNYMYGMTSLPFWPYLLATTLAMLPGHFLYCFIGQQGKNVLEGSGSIGIVGWVAPALSAASALLLTALLTRLVRKYRPIDRPD